MVSDLGLPLADESLIKGQVIAYLLNERPYPNTKIPYTLYIDFIFGYHSNFVYNLVEKEQPKVFYCSFRESKEFLKRHELHVPSNQQRE